MKLIYCTECHDIVALDTEIRACKCGASCGFYVDDLVAEVAGPCVVLGIDNRSLAYAVRRHNDRAPMGFEFTAFAVSDSCPTVKREEPATNAPTVRQSVSLIAHAYHAGDLKPKIGEDD